MKPLSKSKATVSNYVDLRITHAAIFCGCCKCSRILSFSNRHRNGWQSDYKEQPDFTLEKLRSGEYVKEMSEHPVPNIWVVYEGRINTFKQLINEATSAGWICYKVEESDEDISGGYGYIYDSFWICPEHQTSIQEDKK